MYTRSIHHARFGDLESVSSSSNTGYEPTGAFFGDNS
jgi:hypothetical protein